MIRRSCRTEFAATLTAFISSLGMLVGVMIWFAETAR